MIDLVQTFITLVAGWVVGWTCHSYWSGGSARDFADKIVKTKRFEHGYGVYRVELIQIKRREQ